MRKKSKPLVSGHVLFDVLYEDGSRSSNRRVQAVDLTGLQGDDAALEIIAEQDRVIGERSGLPRPAIKKISRS